MLESGRSSSGHKVNFEIGISFAAIELSIRGKRGYRSLIEAACFDKSIAGLYRTSGDDGTFCYTFFKARAICG